MLKKLYFFLTFFLTLNLSGCKSVYQQKIAKVKIIALNDFHGNIRPQKSELSDLDFPQGPPIYLGGIEALGSWVKKLKAKNPLNIFVSAGDLIGASPLLSNFFHDEPTIEAMNSMALELNAIGNHELDHGVEELLRMQHGECHKEKGCRYDKEFKGAKFKFLSANLKSSKTGKTLFPAYEIKYFANIPVAFVGITPRNTLDLLHPGVERNFFFQDEVKTLKEEVLPELKKKGINAIVLLLHEGGEQKGGYNDCHEPSGPALDILNELGQEIDLVISGHTHNFYKCDINGKLLTSAGSYGRLISEIDIELDPKSKRIIKKEAQNILVKTNEVEKDPIQTAIINKASRLNGNIEEKVIGITLSPRLSKEPNKGGLSPLGSLIANAQLEATKAYGAQIAFLNPGGIRNSIMPNEKGEITYGQLFSVQPYHNDLLIINIKGSEIKEVLEQQWIGPKGERSLIFQISKGFSYKWDAARPIGNKVDAQSMKLNGKLIDPEKHYKITINDFLYKGGDSFVFPKDDKNLQKGPIDIEASEIYFKKNSPLENKETNQIERIN